MVRFLNKLTRIKEGEQDSVSEGEEAAGSTEPEAAAESAGGGNGKDWIDENYEGQLSVDVYGTASEVVVVSTIAGVKPEDIDISISNDMLTIRGQRSQEKEESISDSYYQECYWGDFSRSIILPVEVEADKVEAYLKNGVLTVRLPRARRAKSISVRVKEE